MHPSLAAQQEEYPFPAHLLTLAAPFQTEETS